MRSPQYGHPAFSEIATGYGPCRACLRTFDEGQEERLSFTYNAFEGLSDLPLPGPIFIHTDDCDPFRHSGFPEKLRDLPMLFEGFGESGELVVREKVQEYQIEYDISNIFTNTAIKYINLRNSEAGCFIARIDRKD